jgi:hypothetical protein
MKNKYLVGVVLFVVFFFASGVKGANNESIDTLVVELRGMYEKALAARAGSPDFLEDLGHLISRFETSVSYGGISTISIVSSPDLMSETVEVVAGNSFPGKQDEVGKIYYNIVTGSDRSRIWGSGIYTSDSDLGSAAVHAGILQPDEVGIIATRTLRGQERYEGTTRNGITSSSYGSWALSFEFVSVDESRLVIENPGNLSSYKNLVGRSLAFLVTGDIGRGIWGTDIYTLDSNLATAAVHAGILREGETGIIMVEFLPGQDSYRGTSNYGVSSSNYGSYGASYRLRKVHQ